MAVQNNGRVVQKWLTVDGSAFDTEEGADAYQENMDKAQELYALLNEEGYLGYEFDLNAAVAAVLAKYTLVPK